MEECSHEAGTSDLLFGQSKRRSCGSDGAKAIHYKRLPTCVTATTRQSKGFWRKLVEYVQENEVDRLGSSSGLRDDIIVSGDRASMMDGAPALARLGMAEEPARGAGLAG